jgi:preprotein translocase subunit SecA
MINKILKMIVGSRNDRVVGRMFKVVEKINALETEIKALSDEGLQAKTAEFRERLEQGQTLDEILPEAFAVVREAGVRILGMRHFDVQMIGGMVLHEGKIAEMRTGEGKTLVATLPAYLNALSGKSVHIITVNDYLAQRDAEWMGKIYRFLGMTVGVVISDLGHEEKQKAYQADIVYGTNNEFGFDYLRDNMAFSTADKVQRDLSFAIVDEVDSILIDEARTPLIISGPAEDSTEAYKKINRLIPKLIRQESEESEGDYWADEKSRQVQISETGHQNIERLLVESGLIGEDESLYSGQNLRLMHYVNAALRAHSLYQRDVHYLVKDDQVIIIDEFTGRTMPGRRWSEGLHQAVEAKEGVKVQNESQTLASITFQNLFRLYTKLSGMTGTADTEAAEFQQIYNLEVIVIPTHRPMIRKDHGDLVFLTQKEKFEAIVEDIKACVEQHQPVLVGTVSVETSELLSQFLDQYKIKHEVLNAKQHRREAFIVEQAGKPGAVTIATNMAGRGTDIVLGGNLEAEIRDLGESATEEQIAEIREAWKKRHEQVLEAGGLHIIGTERHESRRIDNQLRGRSGRQGDPGSSRFYLSLEDNLMRIFASDRMAGLMKHLGMQNGEAIEHPWVSRSIEGAQRKVESHNFDIRKHLLEFDDVANDQRRVIYEQRNELMEVDDVSETIEEMRADVVNGLIDQYIPPGSMDEQWNISGLETALESAFVHPFPVQSWLDEDASLHEENLRTRILDIVIEIYREKEAKVGAENMRRLEKQIMLQVLDGHWKEHLSNMDYLRQGIHLRSYAQKDPRQEYKREAFVLFESMIDRFKQATIEFLSKIQVREQSEIEEMERRQREAALAQEMRARHEQVGSYGEKSEADAPDNSSDAPHQPFVRQEKKLGRNDPCSCGSGKKYKHCCGRLD